MNIVSIETHLLYSRITINRYLHLPVVFGFNHRQRAISTIDSIKELLNEYEQSDSRRHSPHQYQADS